MSLCLNTQCGSDTNPAHSLSCLKCGTPLRLKQKYRSLKLLGQGGFGKTFLAVDETQPQKPRCVIKQFLPSDRPERFREEAKKLAKLGKYPQIPDLLDYVESNGSTYLIQEFIAGETLEQTLQNQGPFTPQTIFEILHNLLPTLQKIHAQQVIHRDIKPANLIQSQSGKLYLVDFGAAKTLTGTHMVQTGTIIGSARFTAPEQAIGKAIYASDIYSLGVTCIYLLTQISPFTLYDISEGAWVWQDYLTQPVPDSLSRILNKMLLGPTKHRYASCKDVLRDLPGSSPVATATAPEKAANDPPQKLRVNPRRSNPTLTQSPQPTHTQPSPAENSDLKTVKLAAKLQLVLEGHQKGINAVALSPNQQHVATTGSDGYIRLWSMDTGQTRRVLMKGDVGAFDALEFSPDGALIAAGGWDGIIRIWQTKSGAKVCEIKAHDGTINVLKFSPNGQWFASGGYDGNIYLWEKQISQQFLWSHLLHFKTAKVISNPHQGWVTDLAFSPDNQILASVGWNGTLKSWDATGKPKQTLQSNDVRMESIAFHPNSRIVATAGGSDRALTLWDIQSGERIRTLAGKAFVFTHAVFSHDGRQLITTCSDGQIRTLNVNQGGCSYRRDAHSRSITALAIRGRTIVTGSVDKIAKVWTLQKSV